MPGYQYSEEELRKRASSGGKDSGRMHTADDLYARATQPPHEDDAAALASLKALSGLAPGVDQDGKRTEGWATADARNYGKLLVSKADPSYQADYDHAHDGSSGLLHTLGQGLRIAAPIAGALIPGVGMLGAAAIGGLGNAGGNLLAGRGFNPLESLGAGAVGGIGNRLLGNGLGSGSSNFGFGATQPGLPGQPSMGGAPGGGGPAAPGTPGNMTPGMAPGSVSPIGAAGAAGGRIPWGDLAQRYGPLVMGGLGAIQAAGAQQGANNTRDQALEMAREDMAGRAPLRAAAANRLLGPQAPRADLSAMFADPGDPYHRPAVRPITS
jgi:hypothetical protein